MVPQDMLEGFFPYELKEKYPDGQPLDVHDCTWQLFKQGDRLHRPFSRAGEGQRLGDGLRQVQQQRLLPGLELEEQVAAPMAAVDGAAAIERLSMDQMHNAGSKASKQSAAANFLNNLPKNVIRNGRIIPVDPSSDPSSDRYLIAI